VSNAASIPHVVVFVGLVIFKSAEAKSTDHDKLLEDWGERLSQKDKEIAEEKRKHEQTVTDLSERCDTKTQLDDTGLFSLLKLLSV